MIRIKLNNSKYIPNPQYSTLHEVHIYIYIHTYIYDYSSAVDSTFMDRFHNDNRFTTTPDGMRSSRQVLRKPFLFPDVARNPLLLAVGDFLARLPR